MSLPVNLSAARTLRDATDAYESDVVTMLRQANSNDVEVAGGIPAGKTDAQQSACWAPRSLKDAIASFQIETLLNEVKEMERLEPKHDARPAIPLPLRELYWTLTRWTGLSRRQDRLTREALSRRPTRAARPDTRGTRRILIDLTYTHVHQHRSGIQRVVRSLVKACSEHSHVVPVIVLQQTIYPYFVEPGAPDTITPSEDDTYVFLDFVGPDIINWVADQARRERFRIVSVVYDLIPLKYPGLCAPGMSQFFVDWLDTVLTVSDRVLTISQAVNKDLAAYVDARTDSPARRPDTTWFHLGCELDHAFADDRSPTERIGAPGSYFLSVGTLEPRKGHATALDAFERYWARGGRSKYVIAGSPGWSTRALIRRIEQHPEYGNKLIWVKGAGDAAIETLYREAKALIMPSIDEGFGLPLIEAGRHGTPLIVSDIPPFREICGDSATYFPVLDHTALSDVLTATDAGALKAPSFPTLSWSEAAKYFLELVQRTDTRAGQWMG